MANTYIVTQQTNWNRLTATQSMWFTVHGALSNPGVYAHKQALWTTDFDPNSGADAGRVVISGVPESGSISWKFYSSGTDADTGEARIWGITRIFDSGVDPNTEYLADYLCKLDLTTGSKGIANLASNMLPECKFIDTISVTEDRSIVPGGRVISFDDNAAAVVVFDGLGYWGYIVEVAPKVLSTVDWGVLYRIF